MSIYISGSVAYDRIMTFPGLFEDHILPDKLHIVNISFLVDDVREHCGGTAGNIAYTAALLGESPITLASVGKDFDRYERRMRNMGMPLEGIRVIEDEFTPLCFITTDRADNQISGFCPSAMNYPCKYEFKDIKIETIPAYNINKQFHPRENNWVGYILTINQYKYYVAGDTDITKENKSVKCDVAFVPVGGTYTMDAKEAVTLVNEIKPKIAVPIHYGEIVGSEDDAIEFVNNLNKLIEGKILK